MGAWVIGIGDDALGQGFRHTPPTNGFDVEVRTDRGQAGRAAPEALAMVGDRLRHQRLETERDHRHPGDAMAQAGVPESGGRELRLNDHRAARPVRRQHRVALGIGME